MAAFALLGAMVCPATRGARAESTPDELGRLLAGEVIVQEDTVENQDRRYVGGVAKVVIAAPVADVAAALDDVGAYGSFLPRTRSVRWIGLSRKSGDAVVQLEQGTAMAHGHYTVRIRKERIGQEGTGTVRFWLDPSFSHDIADARGFFRVEPMRGNKTLLTYMILVDLGPGILRRFFEERVRRAALSTPLLVRGYVEDRTSKRAHVR